MNQNQLAGFRVLNRIIDAIFPRGKPSLVAHAGAEREAFAEQLDDVTWLSTANVITFVQNHSVKMMSEQLPLANHVTIAAVTGCGIDGRSAFVREALQGIEHALQGRWVVPVIDHKGQRPVLQNIESPRRSIDGGLEGFEPGANDFSRNANRPSRRGSGHRILDLEANFTAVRDRDSIEGQQRKFTLPVGQNHRIVADKNGFSASFAASDDVFEEVRDHVLLPLARALPDAAAHLTRTLTDALIDALVNEIPGSWLAADRAFDDVAQHRDAYRTWLRARRGAIPALVTQAERARG